MKKKIAILGSTGSIGKTLMEIIDKQRDKIDIVLLTANKDYKKLFFFAKKYKVNNLIITDKNSYKLLKSKTKNLNINIFNDFNCFDKIFKKKIDYVMSSIIGIDGLYPTIKIIKFTKKIAIANKESIICGWDLINKEIKKNKTEFIPVDSEHFSLWYGLKNIKKKEIEKLYLTASGGPFLNLPLKSFKKISVKQALKHPNWKMGNKISIDSATMINKVFEIIEAKNIFDVSLNKIEILIHPKSYIHAICKTYNGLIKIIAHDTTMKIPIFNSIFSKELKKIKTNKINLNLLNKLNFEKVNPKRFPMINLLKKIPKKNSLFETVIVSANDTLVDLFFKKKIHFVEIQKELFKIIRGKDFLKYKKIYPSNVDDIVDLNEYVRLKIMKKVYKSNDIY